MKRALVVDDTKNIRVLLGTCLNIYGYDVITANNGRLAIDKFKNENIDIAFLDIKLPEMSGTRVLKYIRSININIPVVIMTAFGTIKNAVECTKLGSVAYLQKPFTAEKVQKVLDEIQVIDEKQAPENNDERNEAKNVVNNEVKNDIDRDVDIYLNMGKTDEALEYLKKIIAANLDNSKVYYNLSRVYKYMGDSEEALIFNKMAELLK